MKEDILKIFSVAELSAMRLTGEVQCVNGYYFVSDSALTMDDRASILQAHTPRNGVVSHQLASWLLCCRFEPPNQLYFSAQPGKKLKQDSEHGVITHNPKLELSELWQINNLLVTSPRRTFIDILFATETWSPKRSSELYSLQRLAKINNAGLQTIVQNSFMSVKGMVILNQYFELLRSLDSVNVINPVDPTYRIK